MTYQDFGEPMPVSWDETKRVEEVLADVDAHTGQTLQVKGQVVQVCEHAGCWLEMGAEGLDEKLFIKFTCPIEGRLIPMEAMGQVAVVSGKLKVEQIDEETAKHFAAEGGKTPEEVEAIKGPQQIITMEAPSARVFGITPPATQPLQ